MSRYFPVGARVVIRESSCYYGNSHDNPPSSVVGTVYRVSKGGRFVYGVEWDNGRRNDYPRGHLKRSKVEKKEEPPKPPLKTFEEKVEEVRGLFPRYTGSHNGVGVLMHENPPLLPYPLLTGPCHSFARGRGRGTSCVVTLVRRRSGVLNQCKKEVCLAYYDWVFNRSPYAEWFLTKDATECWEKYSAVVSSDAPGNMMQGALILTRHTWEFPSHIDLWWALVQEGVPENIAFVVCMKSSFDGEEVTPSNYSSDHSTISAIITMSGAKAFVENSPLVRTNPYKEGGEANGVQAAWTGQEGGDFFAKLREEFNKYDFLGRGDAKARNPFSACKVDVVKRVSPKKYAEFIKEKIQPLILGA